MLSGTRTHPRTARGPTDARRGPPVHSRQRRVRLRYRLVRAVNWRVAVETAAARGDHLAGRSGHEAKSCEPTGQQRCEGYFSAVLAVQPRPAP